MTSNEIWVIGDVGILRIHTKNFGLKRFVFDKDMVNNVRCFKWEFKPNGSGNDYAHAEIGERPGFRSTITLHRLLTSFNIPIVDHKDRNYSNNRLSNLRAVSISHNLVNSHTHDMKGIMTIRGMYEPTIIISGKDVKLGRTNDLQLAKTLYRKAHFKQHGEFSPYTSTGELK